MRFQQDEEDQIDIINIMCPTTFSLGREAFIGALWRDAQNRKWRMGPDELTAADLRAIADKLDELNSEGGE